MIMNLQHPAFTEVVHTCAKIQQLFSGSSIGPAIWSDLLSHFSDSYSMVTTGGQQLDYGALAGFFAQAAGSKPGMEIRITDLELLHEREDIAIVSYKEEQVFGDGSANLRWSTAVFDKDADGRLLWRHLHETTIA